MHGRTKFVHRDIAVFQWRSAELILFFAALQVCKPRASGAYNRPADLPLETCSTFIWSYRPDCVATSMEVVLE